MNHNEVEEQKLDFSSLESDSKNYKSLFEEIAQNNTNIYLDEPNDVIRYKTQNITDENQCCCCKIHRRNSKIPIYNTIWIGEMKNASDYIEYLNKTRRNSFNNSLNRDNRSNYYRLLLSNETNSLNRNDESNQHRKINDEGRFLQVPKINVDEQLRRTPELEDISKKIDQIHSLDSSCSALIIKSIEVHADILSLDATVSRLLAETKKLLEDLEDVKCLDDIIEMLNTEIPIIHREWMYHPVTNLNKIPIDEGIIVSSLSLESEKKLNVL